MGESYEIIYKIMKECNEDDHIALLKCGGLEKTKFLDYLKKKPNKQYTFLKDPKRDIKYINEISGMIPEDKLSKYIQKFIPFSFILRACIELETPYFSKGDDNFYLIENSCLKEKVFNAPMIRGSAWKGVISKSARETINGIEKLKNEDRKNRNRNEDNELERKNYDFKYFESYVRIFGTGSQEYRELIEALEKNKDISVKLIKYLLFELGMKLNKHDIKSITNNGLEYLKKLSFKFTKNTSSNTPFLQVHKGRAIFYPTYFNNLSLEVINPHDRKTRTGTNPIYYEVVPKGAKGILQVIYIPYDGVLTNLDELKKQVKSDIKFLVQAIEKSAENGIGAKTKLGWGSFKFDKRVYCLNNEINDLNLGDWENLRGEK